MKTTKITYWISSAIVAVMMTFSAYAYLTVPAIKDNFTQIGFPSFFRIELAMAKMLGAVLLLLPVAARIKEWVYAGFAITFISAFISHSAAGDPVSAKVGPVVFMAILIVSYLSYHKMLAVKNVPLMQ
ncbi:MAG: DoxX family protein [Bacteroidota bacterium]